MTDNRPTPLEVRPNAIPDALTSSDQWVAWKLEWVEDRDEWTKVPIDVSTGRYGSSTDPTSWTSFEDACAYHEENDTEGIGFVVSEDDTIVGLDLDDCRDPETGDLEEWAEDVIDSVPTYTEISPSGTGARLFGLGFLPEGGNRADIEDGHIEMYDNGRYFTVTGHHLDGTPDDLEEVNDEIEELHEEHIADDEATVEEVPETESLPDDELLDKARNADNGEKFRQLWSGDTSGYESHSEARQALANLLAFWTGGDGGRMLRLFRSSDLYRGEDDLRTFENYEIPTALEGRTEFYTPSQSNENLSLEDDLQTRVVAPYFADDGITITTARHRTAEILDDHLDFLYPGEETRGWMNKLHVYVDGEIVDRPTDVGTYQPYAESEIERLGEEHLQGLFDNTFASQVIKKLKRRNHARAYELSPPPERLVVDNGILDLTTGELSDHTAREFHQTRIDSAYDPTATCPRIDEFLHSVVGVKDVPTLYRFIAHALYKGYPESKAVMLLGDGENGKSTFLNLVEVFLNSRNVSHQTLKDITERRFATNELRNKLANIHPDISNQSLDNLQMFKNLTGGDTIQADVKYESPIKFTNHATLFFACNDLPALNDDSRGHWRRWSLIWFTESFEVGDDDHVPREQLDRELTVESELQGLLNRCVQEVMAWDNGRAWFPDVDDWKRTREVMKKAAEPVYDFAEACLRPANGNHVPKDQVREAFAQYAKEEGLAKMNDEEFGKQILNLPNFAITAKQKRQNGKSVRVYDNIEFSSRGQQVLQRARGSKEQNGESLTDFT